MKRNYRFLSVLLFVMILAVSCSSEIPDSEESLVSVRLHTLIVGSKSISPVVTEETYEPVAWKYEAIPSFSGKSRGKTDSPVSLDLKDNRAVVEGFSQGEWTFTVSGYNKTGGLVLQGSKTVNLNLAAAKDNVVDVDITVKPTYETGITVDVTFDIEAPLVGDDEDPALEFSLMNSAGTAITATSLSCIQKQGKHILSGTEKLAPGTYTLIVINKNADEVVGGQAVSFRVVGKTPITIKGDVETGTFIAAGINVSITDFSGTIEKKTDAYEFVLSASSLTPTKYQWYINGEPVTENGTGKTLSFTPDKDGIYCIACVATHIEGTYCEVCSDSIVVDTFDE